LVLAVLLLTITCPACHAPVPVPTRAAARGQMRAPG
jgi:hypothetical protein